MERPGESRDAGPRATRSIKDRAVFVGMFRSILAAPKPEVVLVGPGARSAPNEVDAITRGDHQLPGGGEDRHPGVQALGPAHRAAGGSGAQGQQGRGRRQSPSPEVNPEVP